ncbi:nitroreductase family deazaflavin-dependent oxidoreductase [Gordonia sp. zg691]|uniref:nitroreductase/quinone reductase family protein n=1 Tax=Gordonia jinghuaiqii TaxID=2758710 RepID=UPI0016628B74|nr:nitroreductase/quinone reductase family protein [Gordonia jinghuaiqii]MBD0860104.1 nitroreductase family deazaflavin-dependent oxidoreductase [Gordonia jinghuaiqii]
MMATTHYRAPRGIDNVFNRAVRRLADSGVNLAGAQTLTVAGRRTGEPQRVPVNVLRTDSGEYLVSPRGNTQWVRNARVADTVELRRGRRRSVVALTEVDPALRPPIIRQYLRSWGWEVGRFLPEGMSTAASDAEIAAHASQIPVFAVTPAR